MSKYIDDLYELVFSGQASPLVISFDTSKFFQVIDEIREALQRLEAIDNVKPSEALKCLKYLDEECGCFALDKEYKAVNTIKQALIKAQDQEKENDEYKKMLKILFKKQVDINEIKILIANLKHCDDVERCKRYNASRKVGYKLKQDEFNSIKEMLK